MNIYIVSGEESGDLHGANLAKELYKINNSFKIRAIGGDKLEEEGVEIFKNISDLSIMGVSSVIKNIFQVHIDINSCKDDILRFNTKILILIDFPGFNLKIARFAKQKGIKVIYYISPKIWAWNSRRVHQIKKYVDEMIVIFPFEVEFYKKYKIDVHYFGNPLYDLLKNNLIERKRKSNIISILPGSRSQEVKRNLNIMLKIISYYPDYQFIIASTKSMYNLCKKIVGENKNIDIVVNQTYSVLKNSKVSLVTSGTATLEAALLKTPQIVCYKTDFLTFILAKIFIKIKWISLVNILMNKNLVKELIQYDMNLINLKRELDILLLNNNDKLISEYYRLDELLESKDVSKKIAKFITSA